MTATITPSRPPALLPGACWWHNADQCRSGPAGAGVGSQQPVAETTEAMGLPAHRFRNFGSTCSEQPESGLKLLALAIRSFEVLRTITHGAAIGLGKPERRVIRGSVQLVTQMSETTLLQPNPMDRRHEALSHLESNKSATAAREVTMIGQRVIGRGSLLAHTSPPGGRWLSVKGRGRGKDRR